MKIIDLCSKPNVDVPGIKCSHPLPCPRHLDAVIEVDDGVTTLTPLTVKGTEDLPRLKDIAKALGNKS